MATMETQLKEENEALRLELLTLREQLASATNKSVVESHTASPFPDFPKREEVPLTKSEVERYGRQLIMSEIGAKGQRKLIASSVLIVGAGGLTSTSAMYLAGAGVGTIGVVDFDHIEVSNLHRQVIHKTAYVGTSKAESAVRAIREFNPEINAIAYRVHFTSANAMEIVKPYDLVLDCTDNVVSRYLINDACVLSGKTLVSGSALRMEGQVTVYNLTPQSPCYRCMFPEPPPRAAQGSCSNEGVLGVVPGIIGNIQALEAVKILAGIGQPLDSRMIMFDAMSSTFRNFKLRSKDKKCKICGENPSITSLVDYELFCGGAASNDKPSALQLVSAEKHIEIDAYARDIYHQKKKHILLDVRPSLHYDICAVQPSVNIPLSEIDSRVEEIKKMVEDSKDENGNPSSLYVICRRGNDSQRAVVKLESLGITNTFNVTGGVAAWHHKVDPEFPIY